MVGREEAISVLKVDTDKLRKLIESMVLLEVVPWLSADLPEKAGRMAQRVAWRTVAEVECPGDGYNGAMVRAACGRLK